MRKFICALLTLILTAGVLFSCGGKDSSGKIQKPDGDAASLLLALQRLDSKALSEGNLLDSGKGVLMALSDTVNGFVTLMGKDTVHDHGEHGRVTVSVDTYIWDKLGDYSNYYSYFENITGNVSSTALQGATMIDGFKDNVRVVDKWVESSEQYYLTVSENSETLFTRDTDGNVRLCRRFKNEKGQNVYELYFTDKAQTMRTRMAYIPDSVIEYSYTYTGDGEPFHHDFFAYKDKGYWEVYDLYTNNDDMFTILYVAIKNDIIYSTFVDTTAEGVTPGMLNVIGGNGSRDVITLSIGEEATRVSLHLQGFNGFDRAEATVPPEYVSDSYENFDGKLLYYSPSTGEASILSSEFAVFHFDNGQTMKTDDTLLDGKVSVSSLSVGCFNVMENEGTHLCFNAVADLTLYCPENELGSTLSELFDALGITPKDGTDTTLAYIERARKEVDSFCKYGFWRGASVSDLGALKAEYAKEETMKKALYAEYTAVKDAPVISADDQKAMDMSISFSPVTLSGSSSTFSLAEGGNVSLTLHVTDTLLFVEGKTYTVGVALLPENGELGLVHIDAQGSGGSVYNGGQTFEVNGNVAFNVGELESGKYTLVAYAVNEKGIRCTEYLPVTFGSITEESERYAGSTLNVSSEDGHLILTYRYEADIVSNILAESVSYGELLTHMGTLAAERGVLADALIESCTDTENGVWKALSGDEEALGKGAYRIGYTVEGKTDIHGYVIIEIV